MKGRCPWKRPIIPQIMPSASPLWIIIVPMSESRRRISSFAYGMLTPRRCMRR
jgi:hypothetical protein